MYSSPKLHVTRPLWPLTSIFETVSPYFTAIIIAYLLLFKELNKLDFNFYGDFLRQFERSYSQKKTILTFDL